MNLPATKLLQALLAFVCATGAAFLSIFFVIHPVFIREFGSLSAAGRTGYVTGVTIIATLVTQYITSNIQTLLFRRLNCDLANWNPLQPLSILNKRWRAILNIDDLFFEKFRIHALPIHIGYWIVALITTSVVTSVQPFPTEREFAFVQEIPNGPSTHIGSKGNCTGVFDYAALSDKSWPYFWQIGGGEVFLVQTKEGGCPTRDAQMVLGNINTFDVNAFAIADGGIGIHRSALGAPRTIYSPEPAFAPALDGIMKKYDTSTLKTKQCSRVMARNPISCRPGSGAIVWQNPWLNISADDGQCDYFLPFSSTAWAHYNSASSGAMAKTMCAHGEIGQGTMVIGASGGYAHWLAVAINDLENAPWTEVGSTYVVSCTVDTRDVFEYRTLSLSLQNLNATESRLSRLLKATDEPCSGPAIDRALIATAASANWQTLFQNDGTDGWFDLVWQATGNGRGPPYAFANSANALEDVLGLVAAMVVSRMNSSEGYVIPSSVLVSSVRVGSGQLVNMVFAIPPIIGAVVLLLLIVGAVSSDSVRFDARQLGQLFHLGQGNYQ